MGVGKITGWMETHKKKWWFSAMVNLLLLTVLLVFLRPVFETNDDTTIYELTGGAKGVYDSHTFFIHVFIGKILEILYRILPVVQWYTVLQYAVMYVSFTAILYVLLNRLRTGMAVVVFGALYCYFAYEGFIIIQFSKTAGYAACAGMLLMFHGLERLLQVDTAEVEKDSAGEEGNIQVADVQNGFGKGKKCVYLSVILGTLLALTGSMYRFKEFFLCAALMSGIGVYTLLKLNWKQSKEALRKAFSYVISFGLLFLLSIGLNAVDVYSYASAAGWENYREFNDMRSNLLDYGFPDYEANRETYESLGITKEDYNLYKSGNHADPELFTREVMETLTALCERKPLNREFVQKYFAEFPLGFFEIYAFTCFLLMFCYWIFWGRKGRGEIAALIYEVFIVGLVYAYLFYMGRYLIRRTETALWLGASLMIIWMLKREQVFFSMRTAAAFCSCVLAFTMNSWREELRFSERQKNLVSIQQGEREFQEILGADKNYLYLTKLGTVSTFTAYGPFDAVPYGLTTNICKLGGWEYGAATNDQILAQYGVENPYRDMIDHPQVLVVDDKVNTTLDYLRSHYNPEAEADLVKKAGGRNFYSFRSKPLTLNWDECEMADEKVHLSCEQTWNKNKLTIRGCLYREETNSFTQRIYLRIEDMQTGQEWYKAVPGQAAEGKSELLDGLYGGFEYEISLKDTDFSRETVENGRYAMELILETGGICYRCTEFAGN